MASNLERYKSDLDKLIEHGDMLHNSLQAEVMPNEFQAYIKQNFGSKSAEELRKRLPSFSSEYQGWYSEAKVLIKQVLPDRLADFVGHYEKPKTRKSVTFENYRIEDCLQGLHITRGWEKEKVVGPEAAIPHFRQQFAILKGLKKRFESSLFDIRQLVQADLFDSELDAAEELLKNKFMRAAGAISGVVLERHLGQVCDNHSIKVGKKSPTISDFNDALKKGNVIDIAQWRFIQHLGDIRNLCDHDKKAEPTKDQVTDLLAGVRKTTKTLF